MSRSTALPLIPALLASLALLLAGCAAQPVPAPPLTDEALAQDQTPAAAFYKDGQLLLQYGSADRKIYLTAAWPGSDGNTREHRYLATGIDLLAGEAPDSQTLQREWQSVTLLGLERWNEIVRNLLDKLAPEQPDAGTLITLQGADFVISRNPALTAGEVHLHAKIIARVKQIDEEGNEVWKRFETTPGRVRPRSCALQPLSRLALNSDRSFAVPPTVTETEPPR